MELSEKEKSLECVRRFQEGDRRAFDELVQIHKRKAYGFVLGMIGNSEDASDILQEGFLRVYQSLGRFRGDAGFKTWFYRILINLSRDVLRRRGRSRRVFAYSMDEADEDGKTREYPDLSLRPDDQAQQKELDELVRRIASGLSDRQREAFCLRYFQGMRSDEVASVLGCGVSTAKVHIFRALREVGRRIQPYLKEH
ncbi:MAG: sigma-70 family RNA polymerase sigma factor [Candidatus Omnitrophota bacterium]